MDIVIIANLADFFIYYVKSEGKIYQESTFRQIYNMVFT